MRCMFLYHLFVWWWNARMWRTMSNVIHHSSIIDILYKKIAFLLIPLIDKHGFLNLNVEVLLWMWFFHRFHSWHNPWEGGGEKWKRGWGSCSYWGEEGRGTPEKASCGRDRNYGWSDEYEHLLWNEVKQTIFYTGNYIVHVYLGLWLELRITVDSVYDGITVLVLHLWDIKIVSFKLLL